MATRYFAHLDNLRVKNRYCILDYSLIDKTAGQTTTIIDGDAFSTGLKALSISPQNKGLI
jgi:hypothetical protein